MNADIKQLIETYYNELFKYLCRLTSDKAVAEDLLSDLFVKAIYQIKKPHDEMFNWRAWFYRVATNAAISHSRKQRIRSIFLSKSRRTEEGEGSLDAQLQSKQEALRLKKAIDKLDLKHKTALVMQVYHDLSYEEIASTLKINIGTVRSRLNKAKKMVKDYLEVENG